jgi:hypothetical protein
MVFVLESAVRGSRALATTQCKSTLYAPHRVVLEIANPFAERVNVVMQLNETYHAAASDSSPVVFPAFWCEYANSARSLTIEARQTVPVEFTFLPFAVGSYCCNVLLLDESVGEFVYEVRGEAMMPLPVASLACRVLDQPSVTQQLRVPSRNILMHEAIKVVTTRIPRALQDDAYVALGKMGLGPRAIGISAPFALSVNSPFWRVPSTVALPPDAPLTSSAVKGSSRPPSGSSLSANATMSRASGEGRHKATIQDESSALSTQDNGGASIPVMISTKGAGDYPCSVTVARGSDVRIYKIVATVPSTGSKSELRFRVPARSAITQDIPITNTTSDSWSLRCTLSGGGGAFSGPSTLQVQASSSASYPLLFSPSWLCNARATLSIENQNTGDTMEFDLIGVGEDPLAEDHISIECQARQRLTHTFVLNSDSTVTGVVEQLDVESDLAEALTVSGSSLLTVEAGKSSEYLLTLQPLLGGTYTGSISFVNQATGRYRWFTLEIIATSPEPEEVLDIETSVRKAVAVEIGLMNPLDDRVEFDVEIEGSGLLGDAVFSLGPKEAGVFDVLYAPLVAGVGIGAVSFANDRLGQFWYKLNLTSKPAPPTNLPAMSAAVGGVDEQIVTVENPSGVPLELRAAVSNRRVFSAQPSTLELPPYGIFLYCRATGAADYLLWSNLVIHPLHFLPYFPVVGMEVAHSHSDILPRL